MDPPLLPERDLVQVRIHFVEPQFFQGNVLVCLVAGELQMQVVVVFVHVHGRAGGARSGTVRLFEYHAAYQS